MQPPACERYSPRFGSPCASAIDTQKRKKSPAKAGLFLSNLLLLLAEIVMAAAAGLADRTDLRLDCVFIAALRHLVQLVGFLHEPATGFPELRLLLVDG